MKLTLKLRFSTTFGQSLWVAGNHPLFGGGAVENAIPLTYLNQEFWQVTVMLPEDDLPQSGVVYNYILRQPDGSTVCDWGNDKVLTPALFGAEEVVIVDSWNAAGFPENAFYTEPFREVLLRNNQTEYKPASPPQFTHTFKVKAPLLEHGQTLCLLGKAAALGHWSVERPVLLGRTLGEDFLTVSVNLAGEILPMEYKYGVWDLKQRAFVGYEDGLNRSLTNGHAIGRHTIVNDGFARLPADTWKGAGVAIPVFSLRSENSFGVGEFADLERLADWCQEIGLKLIQILPVNDTTSTHTWTDSYPYAAISAFALNPIYLNLGKVASAPNKKLLKVLELERQRLNALPEVDYAAVMAAKLKFIKSIFPSQRTATFRSNAYKEFFSENQHWLTPYAAFCALRDRFGTADSRQWPEQNRCTPELLATLTAEDSEELDEIALHCFIQFHLHQQLQDAAQYAHARGVILKGDIAIGVSRNGSDTWQSPELYDLSVQAGAPPDPFSDKGQNWGFPIYNWPRMMHDGFAWWKRRFGQMGHYFDAFRIDHILGFFRIWSIPANAVEGILGYFVPAIPVELEELAARGIPFDHSRFVEPYITEATLAELFRTEAGHVKETFLRPAGYGEYALRPEYATQQLVEQHFATLEPTEANLKLKLGLFDLISNVLLLEVEGSQGRQFHCRFFMDKTQSFRSLDSQIQERLRDLYVDYFFRRQDDFWMKQALQKLPALKRVTNMLICGEDLGLVPACVPDVMKGLGLLSLEIQRMPKNPSQTFSRPSEAPYLSVVTPSTHDMSTIRGWWTEDRELTQQFYNLELGRPGPAPDQCTGEVNAAIVHQHLASPAMWSIFQLQDLLGMDESLRRKDANSERINIPANPKHYWCYRMHLTLEQLLGAGSFNSRLQSLVEQHGR